MKILVTGGAGYIGSHIVRQLAGRGDCEVVVVDNLQKGHRAAVPSGILLKGDLADPRFLEELFSSHSFTGIVHLAADSLVGESVSDPAKYYQNNIANGLNLLQAARRHGVGQFVFSSSAAVYGEPETTPITEDQRTAPTNPYGWTKLQFEQILHDFTRAYGMRFVSLRYFNAAGADPAGDIGEDHNPETHLIPIVLGVALGRRPQVEVFGTDYPTPDGTCVRDYVHVNDLADAHILALDALGKGASGGIYNLGNGTGFSVKEVILAVEEVTRRPVAIKKAGRRPGDPAVLVADSRRIMNELRWKPRLAELRLIAETAWRWHRDHPKGFEDCAFSGG